MTITKLTDLTTDQLKALSPQLRRAARYVMEHPGEVATRSQRFVARTAQLPAPTFTRLAHAIGYESYDALRDTCRADLLDPRTVLAERAQLQVETSDANASFAIQHAAATIRNTQAMVAQLDTEQLETVARLLSNARKVTLIGVMSSRPVVDYANYLANMALGGWNTLGRADDGVSGALTDLGPQDVCIAFSIEPYSTRAIELANHVTEAQVPLITLTDNQLSPLAEKADHIFYIGTNSPQFFPSHVGATVFFEAIIGMVIQMRGKEAQQRIAAVERQNHKLKEYWQD